MVNTSKLNFQSYNFLPFPVEVFADSGETVFINTALMKLNGITDANTIVGKYNLRTDFICNELMGYREIIKRAFRGETVTISNFAPPVQSLVDLGAIKEKPYESALMEAHLSPVVDCGRLSFVVCVFIVKSIFRGRPEVARAKEYLSRNWRGEFDKHKTAEALGLSASQLYRLFKQYDGSTPGEYHKQCKVEHLKEKLTDKSLTVKAAFEACGEDHKGRIGRVFKEQTGLTPSEYKKGIINEEEAHAKAQRRGGY